MGLLASLLGSIAYQPQANPGAGYDVDQFGNYIGPDGQVVTDPSKQAQLDGTSSAPFVQPSWWQRATSPQAQQIAMENAQFEAAPAYANQKYDIGQQTGARDYANLPSSMQAGLMNPATATTLTGGNFSAPSVYGAMTDIDRANAGIPAKATQSEGSQYGYDDQYYKNLLAEQEKEAQLGVPGGRASAAAAAIPASIAQSNRTAAVDPIQQGIDVQRLTADNLRQPTLNHIADNEANYDSALSDARKSMTATGVDTLLKSITGQNFDASYHAPLPFAALHVGDGTVSGPAITGLSVPAMAERMYNAGVDSKGNMVADPLAGASRMIGDKSFVDTTHPAFSTPNAPAPLLPPPSNLGGSAEGSWSPSSSSDTQESGTGGRNVGYERQQAAARGKQLTGQRQALSQQIDYLSSIIHTLPVGQRQNAAARVHQLQAQLDQM